MVRLGAPLEGSSSAIEALSLDHQTNVRLMKERVYSQLEELNQMISDLQTIMPYDGSSKTSNRNNGINVDIPNPCNNGSSYPVLAPLKPLTEAKKKDMKRELSGLKRQKLWAEICVEKLRMSIRGTILSEGKYPYKKVVILNYYFYCCFKVLHFIPYTSDYCVLLLPLILLKCFQLIVSRSRSFLALKNSYLFISLLILFIVLNCTTADLVAATLSSSGKQQFLDHILLEDLAFDTAIIDEAAQTTEPSTLIPLRCGTFFFSLFSFFFLLHLFFFFIFFYFFLFFYTFFFPYCS